MALKLNLAAKGAKRPKPTLARPPKKAPAMAPKNAKAPPTKKAKALSPQLAKVLASHLALAASKARRLAHLLTPALALTLGLALALGSLSGCGGPLPPQDPFNLYQAKDNLSKGNHWYLRGCHREAARFFEEGLAFARLADDAPLIVMGHNSLGAALLAQGRLKEAAAKLSEALELTLTLPSRPELDSILGNLGTLAFKAKRHGDAEDFWVQATAVAPPNRLAIYYSNLARLYKAQNRPDEFAALTAKALAAAESSLTPPQAKADALSLEASLALSQGERPKALELLEEALSLDRRTENASGLAQNLE
ncbi:MAG: tetratricopeptide repeat protein, partial [Deltaproteobacteria bacterium]|nr:tetratricopeptide repeat protein [Deltaproteobacteria bacterium]